MTGAERDLIWSDFPVHWPVHTRWTDNDMFGHLNNAVYYALFDTAINAWINTSAGLDPMSIPALGIVAESGCRYFSELHFPESLVVGLAVTRLGRFFLKSGRSAHPVGGVGEKDTHPRPSHDRSITFRLSN